MKLRQDWYDGRDFDGDMIEKEVIAAFERWRHWNLTITQGTGFLGTDVFGLPYTSSSECAMLGNVQGEAEYKWRPEWKFDFLAVSEDNEIMAVFCKDTNEGEKHMYVIIGKL